MPIKGFGQLGRLSLVHFHMFCLFKKSYSEEPLPQLFDESTTHVIIEEAIDAAPRNGRIACITCPSIFCSLQESFPSRKADHLFDFDPRYSKYGSNVSILGLGEISQIAPDLQHAFAVIIADVSMLVGCPCITDFAMMIWMYILD